MDTSRLDLKDTIIQLVLLCSDSPPLLRALNAFLPAGWRLNVAMGSIMVELAMPDERVLYPIARPIPQVG